MSYIYIDEKTDKFQYYTKYILRLLGEREKGNGGWDWGRGMRDEG